MDITKLTDAQVLLGFFVSLAALLAAVAGGVRFIFVPRLRDMIAEVVDEKLDAREEANAATIEAEKSAIEDLGERIHRIEDRMSENEKAAAETKATVERIEEATKRQTQTLEAIAEGVGAIKEGFVEQKVKVARAEKDIEDLQRARRRGR